MAAAESVTVKGLRRAVGRRCASAMESVEMKNVRSVEGQGRGGVLVWWPGEASVIELTPPPNGGIGGHLNGM